MTNLERPTRQHVVIYVLLFVLLLTCTSRDGYVPDMYYWVSWSKFIFRHGLDRAYQLPHNNYPPLFLYLLWAYGKLAGSIDKIFHYRYFIKALVLPFDFAGALLAAWYFAPGNREQRFAASLLLLVNIAFVYNTVIWAQVDGLFGTLIFAAVVLALQQRPAASIVCYVLALNTKMQAIIFLPPLLLLWAPLWGRQLRALFSSAGAAVAVQVLILAPFIWGRDPAGVRGLLHVLQHGVDFYPFLSMNAHNMWQIIFADAWMTDMGRWAGLTYKQWGLLSFGLASTVVLLPLLMAAWRKAAFRGGFWPT